VLSVLSRVGVVGVDRLAFLVFLVDRMGGFGAFDWGWFDVVLSSSLFLDTLEGLAKEGILRITGGLVSGSSGDPGCGWLLSDVSLVVDYVLGRFGSLGDDELRILAESLYRGEI